jgi:hypothetical protein
MPKSTRSRRVLIAGLALSGAGVVANALNLAGLDALLPGLMLSVSAAALAAADSPGQDDSRSLAPVPAPRRPATIAVSVLGGLVLVPFVSVGALIFAGADPLAIYLVGLGLFSLSAVLVATFVVVFFASRRVSTRRVASPR